MGGVFKDTVSKITTYCFFAKAEAFVMYKAQLKTNVDKISNTHCNPKTRLKSNVFFKI